MPPKLRPARWLRPAWPLREGEGVAHTKACRLSTAQSRGGRPAAVGLFTRTLRTSSAVLLPLPPPRNSHAISTQRASGSNEYSQGERGWIPSTRAFRAA